MVSKQASLLSEVLNGCVVLPLSRREWQHSLVPANWCNKLLLFYQNVKKILFKAHRPQNLLSQEDSVHLLSIGRQRYSISRGTRQRPFHPTTQVAPTPNPHCVTWVRGVFLLLIKVSLIHRYNRKSPCKQKAYDYQICLLIICHTEILSFLTNFWRVFGIIFLLEKFGRTVHSFRMSFKMQIIFGI